MIKTLEWTPGGVRFIDQTKLPTEEVYVTCHTYQEVAAAIRDMIVRVAPAIGVAAAMGIALCIMQSPAKDTTALPREFDHIAKLLDESRHVSKGARLIAWELMKDGIPHTVSADNMAGAMMRQAKINAVVVGADPIAANCDVANKIGTSTVAAPAKEHGIPFYVAATW